MNKNLKRVEKIDNQIDKIIEWDYKNKDLMINLLENLKDKLLYK